MYKEKPKMKVEDIALACKIGRERVMRAVDFHGIPRRVLSVSGKQLVRNKEDETVRCRESQPGDEELLQLPYRVAFSSKTAHYAGGFVGVFRRAGSGGTKQRYVAHSGSLGNDLNTVVGYFDSVMQAAQAHVAHLKQLEAQEEGGDEQATCRRPRRENRRKPKHFGE